MTTTTTTAPHWTITKRNVFDGRPLRVETQLDGDSFYVSANSQGWFFVCDAIQMCEYLPKAITAEEAIAEAVVTITQRLARLSAELNLIPITLPSP